MKHPEHIAELKRAVLDSAGASEPQLRRAIFELRVQELPENLRHYVDTVQRHAYKVSDEDVEALKRAGYTEDFIFEITGSAALGAALFRMDRAMSALDESGA